MNDLIIISGASGVGKSSLVKTLLKEMSEILHSVSHTTRNKRKGEIDGVDYHFCSEQKFKMAIKNNEFVEHAYIFDCYYGTNKNSLNAQLKTADVIVEIDWQGAKQIKALFANALSIAVVPPSIATLEQRLIARGDEQLSVKKRMQFARDEIGHYDQYDYIIVNKDFDTALAQLKCVIISYKMRLDAKKQTIKTILNYDN